MNMMNETKDDPKQSKYSCSMVCKKWFFFCSTWVL